MDLPRNPGSCFLPVLSFLMKSPAFEQSARRLGSGCLFLFAAVLAAAAPKANWKPVTPAELSETAPQIEPDAPAEVLFWSIDSDDREFPAERNTVEYIRYKIYAPDRVESLTRISQLASSEGGLDLKTVDLRARLTLPNGTVKEFGKEAIQERTLSKSAGEQTFIQRLFGSDEKETKEKFLAITGVEPGAILEYMIFKTVYRPSMITGISLQLRSIPVRDAVFRERFRAGDAYEHRAFLLNTTVGTTALNNDNKACTVTVTAKNVPSLVVEPLAGPRFDYALTVLSAYFPHNIRHIGRSNRDVHLTVKPEKDGPWAATAAVAWMLEDDCSEPTKRVRQVAAQVTEGASNSLERAQRIHRHVQEMFQRFVKLPKPKQPSSGSPAAYQIRSVADILDFERTAKEIPISSVEFLYLEIALLRSATLETKLILLPNRQLTRFDQRLVSPVFLNDFAAGVRIDDEWHFSIPNGRVPTAFDMIPYYNQGQAGLVAHDGKQEFIRVNFTPVAKSAITNIGTFLLGPEGDLAGRGGRRFTGQTAFVIRQRLRAQTPARQKELMKSRLEAELKGAEVAIESITGVDDPESPVDVYFNLRLPGLGVLTKDRLVMNPLVYRLKSTSPFSAPTRRFPIQFDYPWQEVDEFTIELPAGYTPENITPPQPVAGERMLFQSVGFRFDPMKHVLNVRREFASGASMYPVSSYEKLKQWYDAIDDSDHQEYIFVRTAEAAPAADAAANPR